jgi:hypothetical protein
VIVGARSGAKAETGQAERHGRSRQTSHEFAALSRGRKFEPLAQGKRPAIRVPESPLRENEQTQRRVIDRLGLQGRALKVVPGGPPKG